KIKSWPERFVYSINVMLADPRTLAAAAALLYLVLTALHITIYRKEPKYPGFGRWTVSNALIGCGMFIVTFQPSTANWSNILFVTAMILGTEGNREFRGLRARSLSLYLAGVITLIAAAYAEHVRSPNGRNVAIGVFYAVAGTISA